MKRLVIVGAILALTGCAATERVDARNELLALKTCLSQHLQDARVCNGASAAYQADLVMMASKGALDDLGPQASPQPDGGWSFAAR
jgi:hypothetical protein